MTGDERVWLFAEGETGLRWRRVNPLLVLNVRAGLVRKRPAVPVSEFTMPDGSKHSQPNPGDPLYKEELKAFERTLSKAVRDKLLSEGVVQEDWPLLNHRSDEELEVLASVIYAESNVTDQGVSEMMQAADLATVDAVVTARWMDMKVPEFMALPIHLQNLFVGIYRERIGGRRV